MHTATDQPATAEINYGWCCAFPMTRAHFVPEGTEVRWRNNRPYANAPCGYPAILDEAGNATAALVPRCPDCARWVAGECLECVRGVVHHSRDVQSGAAVQWTTPCGACAGTGRHT